MAELANEFSWSRSRDATFQDCRRKYFYQYYGAWGGWDAGAPPDVRRLYILKQLSSRQQWAGRIVHDAVEMAFQVMRAECSVPPEPFIADVIERMRSEWRSSKAAHYRDHPKSPALFEHEYAVPLKPEAWQAVSRNVATCLRHFFQLGCYALYAHEVLGVSPARTDLIEVNLREPTVTLHRWDDDRLAAVRDQLRLSIRAMKAYLADPDANLALIDGFERSEELRICRWCNFRAVCRPEISSEGGFAPLPTVERGAKP